VKLPSIYKSRKNSCGFSISKNTLNGEIVAIYQDFSMIDKNNNIHLLPLMIILEYRNRKAGINN
jgi:hypothetical protein